MPWEGAERAAYMAAKFGDMSKIEENQADAGAPRPGRRPRVPFRLDRAGAQHPALAHLDRACGASGSRERGEGADHAGLFRGGLQHRRGRRAGAPRRRSGPRRTRGSLRGGVARRVRTAWSPPSAMRPCSASPECPPSFSTGNIRSPVPRRSRRSSRSSIRWWISRPPAKPPRDTRGAHRAGPHPYRRCRGPVERAACARRRRIYCSCAGRPPPTGSIWFR